MRVLVTGGAGRLGRCIAHELREHGHAVTLFDRVHPSQARIPWETDLPCVLGEMTSFEDCTRAIQESRADAICHVGGIPHPTDHPVVIARRKEMGLPAVPEDDTFKSNTLGTYYVLDVARRHGVQTIAFASTYFVLGMGNRLSGTAWLPQYLPIDENHPVAPEDSYGLSKLLNEEMLKAYSRAYGMRTVAFRLLGVYYHFGEDPSRRFAKQASPPSSNPPSLVSTWQYVDARDAARAFRMAIEATNLEPFEIFYLATDRTIEESPRDAFIRYFPQARHLAAHLGPDDLLISIDRVRERLGYEPRHSWRAQSPSSID